MQFKPYDLKQAKDGDLIMSRVPDSITEVGEVFAGSDDVVVRWAGGYFSLFFNKNEDHNLVHKPVFMLNEKPVHVGDTIYNRLGDPHVIEKDMNPLQQPKDLDPKEWSFKPWPKTVNINGYLVPWPETRVPAEGATYYQVGLGGVERCVWDDMDHEWWNLKKGLIHLSKENAEKHRAALLSFFEQED